MKLTKAEILSNDYVSRRYCHMKIRIPDWTVADVKPGQFFHIRTTDDYSPLLRRPFSIYRINNRDNILEFLYLVKGAGTKKLAERKPGELLDILGPLGNTFTLGAGSKGLLLIARGVGIATLSALAYKAGETGIPCYSILSARSREDILVEKELNKAGVITFVVHDGNGSSDPAAVRTLAEEIIRTRQIDAVYTCGSKRLALLTRELAERYMLFSEIALEENMGCAMGACFACVCDIKEGDEIRTIRLCQDGPVLPLKKVVFS
ncbi:dihydrdoorotate oxidase [Bacillus sp. FJAT-18017]|uniref:dihydroorotate dehydrogenase electron transfer subunit n=1 Tax=Bacillus sp. FJAT-18017 TaxID=1705566 RepID=UPI0006AF468E|nr:dihydroorotate dehydrogenase electron transfer subunit [Bacillus sp. FJAT-18017]ALC91395.1 dihydrdoorotate oxidase [Bacillus sp. FJAT-18017]